MPYPVPRLPSIPKVELDVIADRSSEPRGFLALKRFDFVVVRADGSRSDLFRYDMVDRPALDAAVIVAHHVQNGVLHVYLRTCLRPPLSRRTRAPIGTGALWELPAGLIEPGETPVAGAARELEEELGFTVAEDALAPLGPWALPAPGFIGEVHWFFHVRVDPRSRREPGGDGSPLEADAVIVDLPLDDALAACRDGEIRDTKTELALRRLADVHARSEAER